MSRKTLIVIAALSHMAALSGCGGITITKGDGSQPAAGYPVYAPMLVVNVTSKAVCKKKDAKGKCTDAKPTRQCVVGAPYYLPDYEEQYVFNIKKGLGSYTGTFTVEDGWMLGAATNTANPSAFLTAAAAVIAAAVDDDNCEEGIYRFGKDGKFTRLTTPFFRN